MVSSFSTNRMIPASNRMRQQSPLLYLSSRVLEHEDSSALENVHYEDAVHPPKDEQKVVDFALVGGLATLTALATMAWIATDSSLVQALEEDPSSATLIVDACFGGVAAFVTLFSGDK